MPPRQKVGGHGRRVPHQIAPMLESVVRLLTHYSCYFGPL